MEKKKEETTDLQKKEKEKRIKKEIARLRKNWHEKGKQIDEVTKKNA